MKDIDHWASSESRTIQITQDYSAVPLIVEVRRFKPREGDRLTKSWVEGTVKKTIQLPPYAFANLKATEQVYINYINQQGPAFFKNIVDHKDTLLWGTYSTAVKASNNAMVSLISLIAWDAHFYSQS